MTPDEIRKLAENNERCGTAEGVFSDSAKLRCMVTAAALRHYADHLDRRSKAERLIEVGNAMWHKIDNESLERTGRSRGRVQKGQALSTEHKPDAATLSRGDLVQIKFGGGIEGDCIGRVIDPKLYDTSDFTVSVEADFWNPLSRYWHRKGQRLVVHARELVAVFPNPDQT